MNSIIGASYDREKDGVGPRPYPSFLERFFPFSFPRRRKKEGKNRPRVVRFATLKMAKMVVRRRTGACAQENRGESPRLYQ